MKRIKIMIKWLSKFKRVYCVDCKHYKIGGFGYTDRDPHCRKSLHTFEWGDDENFIRRTTNTVSSKYRYCKEVRKYRFCFKFELKSESNVV